MNQRSAFFVMAALFTCAPAVACDNNSGITKIVFVDSFGAGVETTNLENTDVCFNFRIADDKLERNRIGKKDTNNRWPAPVSLDSNDEVLRISWPDRSDILARFNGRRGIYKESGQESCAIVGDVVLLKAIRLSLDFSKVDSKSYKDTYVAAKGFEVVPPATDPPRCFNMQRRVSPAKDPKLGFKIAKEIPDGLLEIEVPGEDKRIRLSFRQLVEAADEWEEQSAIRQKSVDTSVASSVSSALIAFDSFHAGKKQIKIPAGTVTVSYEKDK